MIARLRALWLSINASYWFFPALFSLAAALLAFLTVWLDRHGAAEWIGQYEWLEPARPGGASNILTVIAGSMIGVTSTVFSITIAAVAYASGNYGPRLLTNFMEDKGNQLSLATFISTFVYAVMILRVVRAEDEKPVRELFDAASSLPGFVPQLSLLVATILMAISVAVLVYFLNHIPASIRINQVLQGIGERLLHDIGERYPEDGCEREPQKPVSGMPVCADQTGFVTIIDFESLDDVAKEHHCVIALKIRTGDFVHPGMSLAEIKDATVNEELCRQLRDCFSVGSMRTATQDLEFLFDELVEIALRALSPGINDPFTAISALQWMGAATASLAGRALDRGPESQDYDPARVQVLDDDFAHFLRRGFGGARASAAASFLAAQNFLACLAAAASSARSVERRREIHGEGDRLMAQARLDMHGPSLDELERRWQKFDRDLCALGL
ncbi:MAG: DUF2254 domain-containing protein [Blastomonas sp.]